MRTGKLSVKPDEMLGGTLAMDWQPIQGRVEILLVISCHGTDQIPSGVKIGIALSMSCCSSVGNRLKLESTRHRFTPC